MKYIISTALSIIMILFSANILIAQGTSEQNIVEGISGSHVLFANPGPSNNGGASTWAMFLDLIAGPSYVTITGMTTSSNASPGANFSVEFFVRSGTALGGPVSTGPGSSSTGWTSLGTVTATQGAAANGISLLFNTPSITIAPGDTTGVAMVVTGASPRYFGTGSPPLGIYSDPFLTLVTGEVRSIPFTPSGSFFSSRELVGEIHYDDIIPVELTSFTSYVNDNNVALNWITATELNNAGFQIERKTPSTDWINIGYVQGNGTSTDANFYSFVDTDVDYDIYNYRLKQIDYNGSFKYYELAETVEIGLLNNFLLAQNYPNPFNPTTIISWKSPVSTHQTIKIFDVLGNEVATLVDEFLPAGAYERKFSAEKLTSGIYIYSFQAGDFISSKKMILIK